MMKSRPAFIIGTLILGLLYACQSTPELRQPVFTKDYDEIIQEIGATGEFSSVSFTVRAEKSSSYEPGHELMLTLHEGKILPADDHGLDSLAKDAATILINRVQNKKDYDWISVEFQIADQSLAGRKKVFVYRPD
ncbi:hypothetical protein [Flavihumibacter solisilvae]|uniref:Lipoprotein n=1 Tax=Flavihumibacter solisilvae TaxID=1349421 RepID=A0A0C1IER3_9BACT|nr:hypothetical protein [Flavihumibacter solisilvae]KIC92655.1 hypothetical protein OI18_21595 [Flavihumibacter solisilvae]